MARTDLIIDRAPLALDQVRYDGHGGDGGSCDASARFPSPSIPHPHIHVPLSIRDTLRPTMVSLN